MRIKIKTVFGSALFVLIHSVVCGQTYNESIGAQGGGSDPSLAFSRMPDPTTEAYNLLQGHIFRRVNGQICNLLLNGENISGTVESSDNGIIIAKINYDYNNRHVAIKNYPGEVFENKRIFLRGMKVGTYEWGYTPLQFYDCGIVISPQEEDQARIDAQKKFQAQQVDAEAETASENQKSLEEVAILAAKHARYEKKEHFQAESNAMVRIEPLATNGERWAQTSLGEHYMKGDGCQTNVNAAVFWLSKSSALGDLDASNDLKKLQK